MVHESLKCLSGTLETKWHTKRIVHAKLTDNWCPRYVLWFKRYLMVSFDQVDFGERSSFMKHPVKIPNATNRVPNGHRDFLRARKSPHGLQSPIFFENICSAEDQALVGDRMKPSRSTRLNSYLAICNRSGARRRARANTGRLAV